MEEHPAGSCASDSGTVEVEAAGLADERGFVQVIFGIVKVVRIVLGRVYRLPCSRRCYYCSAFTLVVAGFSFWLGR